MMGMDLLTYIVVGPSKLSARAINTARTRVKKIASLVHAAQVVLENAEGDVDDPAFQKAFTKVEKLVDVADDEKGFEETLDDLEEMASKTLLVEVQDVWKSRYRDVNTRDDPRDPSQKIVVAGDMSFGDEPDGGGYQALKAADMLGLFPILGIR